MRSGRSLCRWTMALQVGCYVLWFLFIWLGWAAADLAHNPMIRDRGGVVGLTDFNRYNFTIYWEGRSGRLDPFDDPVSVVRWYPPLLDVAVWGTRSRLSPISWLPSPAYYAIVVAGALAVGAAWGCLLAIDRTLKIFGLDAGAWLLRKWRRFQPRPRITRVSRGRPPVAGRRR